MNYETENSFQRLGAGHCGSVWTPNSECHRQYGSAFKREDGGPGRSLQNDFDMHEVLCKAMDHFYTLTHNQPRISVPELKEFITPSNEPWWHENLKQFPNSYLPCNTLCSERIPAFGKTTRELLIDQYCPPSLVPKIKSSVIDRDCMIRPYLGRRRLRFRESRFKAFSLRNFLLHVDQMEDLEISDKDTLVYSETMAETLAIMHWIGKMDANDVEFVLAPPRTGDSAAIHNVLGGHTMWILDFDCCRPISFDAQGVKQAVRAFIRNDPFYPRPTSSPTLWASFRSKYLQTSHKILSAINAEKHVTELPEVFVLEIEDEIAAAQLARISHNSEAN